MILSIVLVPAAEREIIEFLAMMALLGVVGYAVGWYVGWPIFEWLRSKRKK